MVLWLFKTIFPLVIMMQFARMSEAVAAEPGMPGFEDARFEGQLNTEISFELDRP